MNKEKVTAFLEDLSALTRKHGIAISGNQDGAYLFYPFYCGRFDRYSCDLSGDNLVFSGDTIQDRSEFRIIQKGDRKLKLSKKKIKELEQAKVIGN